MLSIDLGKQIELKRPDPERLRWALIHFKEALQQSKLTYKSFATSNYIYPLTVYRWANWRTIPTNLRLQWVLISFVEDVIGPDDEA